MLISLTLSLLNGTLEDFSLISWDSAKIWGAQGFLGKLRWWMGKFKNLSGLKKISKKT